MKYPEWALEKRVQGITEVAVTIRRDGTVKDAKIVQTSGYDRLDSAAIFAVKRIRIRIQGQDPSLPVFGWQGVRVQYRL